MLLSMRIIMFRDCLDVPDIKGYTPFHYAVKQNNHHLVRVLLRAKAFVVGKCIVNLQLLNVRKERDVYYS